MGFTDGVADVGPTQVPVSVTQTFPWENCQSEYEKIVQDLPLRKARSLLNKLAESSFDSIASQIALFNQTNSSTLRLVVKLCIDTALSQPERSGLYARLCRAVYLDGINHLGGPLFRDALLSRLQEEFETETIFRVETRWYLSLVQFMAKLFKVQMLTERFMRECIKMLFQNVEYPLEADMEAIYVLLHSIGLLLDAPTARAHLDVYKLSLRFAPVPGHRW
ncbi:armadillo-type protein [Mycena leptocephala]|nr:armadillo-type protein [Mycena leptocephala]